MAAGVATSAAAGSEAGSEAGPETGPKTGRVKSSPSTSSKATCTRIPILACSGSGTCTRLSMRTPSSRSISPMTYGTSAAKAGPAGRRTTVREYTVPWPLTWVQLSSSL